MATDPENPVAGSPALPSPPPDSVRISHTAHFLARILKEVSPTSLSKVCYRLSPLYNLQNNWRVYAIVLQESNDIHYFQV